MKLPLLSLPAAAIFLAFSGGAGAETLVLPDGFAFADLLNGKGSKRTARELLPRLPQGAVLLFMAKEVALFSSGDAVCGLKGHGLKLTLVTNGPMKSQPIFMGDKLVSGGTIVSQATYSKNPLGSLNTFRDANGVTITGLVSNEGKGEVTSAAKIEWTSEPLSCYRAGALLGIWDPQTKSLRPAQPGEAADTLPAAALKDAVVDGLPSKLRLWTNAQGLKINARVVDYDPKAETLTLDVAGRGTTKNYPLSSLSLEDQTCVIAAHACQSAMPKDVKKSLKP